jgi:hypothetical protein
MGFRPCWIQRNLEAKALRKSDLSNKPLTCDRYLKTVRDKSKGARYKEQGQRIKVGGNDKVSSVECQVLSYKVLRWCGYLGYLGLLGLLS